MKTSGKCPLCGEEYDEVRIKTMHHVLPKFWYNKKGPTVEICSICHNEFNHKNPMIKDCRWSKKDSLWRLIRFCDSKDKNLYDIYPNLFKETMG